MRNYFALTIFAVAFFACKKDRVCDCTVTSTTTTTTRTMAAGFPPFIPMTDTTSVTNSYLIKNQRITLKDISNKKAKYNCINKEEPVDESNTETFAGTFTVTTTKKGNNSYSCILE